MNTPQSPKTPTSDTPRIEEILDELLGEKAPDSIPHYKPQTPEQAKTNHEFAEKWEALRKTATAQIQSLILQAELKARIDELHTISDPENGRAVFKVPVVRIRDRIKTLTDKLDGKEETA